MFAEYGLTGEIVTVRRKNLLANVAEPWAAHEVTMLVLGEYDTFLRFEVLPHRVPHKSEISKPYTVCIHKNDIAIGEVLINGETIA